MVYTQFTVLFLGQVIISCLQNDMDRPPLEEFHLCFPSCIASDHIVQYIILCFCSFLYSWSGMRQCPLVLQPLIGLFY